MLPPRLVFLGFLCLSFPVHAQSGLVLEEPPAWVEPTPVTPADAPSEEDAVAGLYRLLSETQVRVGPEWNERYVRQVRQVMNARGVETGSKFEITYAHAHERLRLHGLWRTRAGVRTQVLRAEDLKLLQRELGLDQGLYQDERTVVAFLPDVRVGDVLEEAHTVEEAHPLFRGQYLDRVPLASGVTTQHQVFRLLAPVDLTLHFKSLGAPPFEPAVHERGALREYRWEQHALRAFGPEDNVPADVAFWPQVQISSQRSWAEVAAWALGLEQALPVSPEVKAQADTWRALPTEEARFLAATRFVQDEVRYLGLEVGSNTHQSHPPGQVLAQRFGDCKDKALLLATLLRELGLPAHVALVSTENAQGVGSMLPSPHAFDHAIVRARVAGRTEWVDATLTHQRGRLGARTAPPFGLALVVAPGVTALEPIARPPAQGLTQDMLYTLSLEDSGAGTLVVEVRLTGEEADAARRRLAGQSRGAFALQLTEQRRLLFPKLSPEQPLEVVDDPDANTVTWVEHYVLRDGWVEGRLSIAAPHLLGAFGMPRRSVGRAQPFGVSHPNHARVRWVVHAGALGLVTAKQETLQGPASRLDMSLSPEPEGFIYTLEYQSLADRVAPDALPRHLTVIDGMRAWVALDITVPPGLVTAASSTTSGSFQLTRSQGLALSALFFLALAAVWLELPRRVREWLHLRRARRSRRPAPRAPVHYLPEVDTEPRVVDGPERLERELQRQRCGCGGALSPLADAEPPRATGSGAKALTRVRMHCSRCGSLSTLSFDVRPH